MPKTRRKKMKVKKKSKIQKNKVQKRVKLESGDGGCQNKSKQRPRDGARSERYADKESPKKKSNTNERAAEAAIKEGEMSQTEVVLGYTRQCNTIQALTEKDKPRASISTSMGDERERQEQDSVRQEGVERREKGMQTSGERRTARR